ncbi:MAG: hypothetical protein K6E50_15580 [Lachnospiraceae bacterium]|nr:hypothetical protein [Lachnospiraceae bacterium]
MKKRCLALIMMLTLLAGCSRDADRSGSRGTYRELESSAEEVEDDEDVEESEEDVSTEQMREREDDPAPPATASDEEFDQVGYLYENSIGDSLYFYVVKNNSKATVEIDGSATAYDAADNELGASGRVIDVLAPGETSVMLFYFDSVIGIDHVDCALLYDTNPFYQPVIGNIALKQTVNDTYVTILATNTGEINAQYVEAYALFFDASGKVVSYDSDYLTDGDGEIKPGATISGQLVSYKDFDHVECFLTGYSNGEASVPSDDDLGNDFAIKEYGFENSIGDSIYYLVFTNNSEKTAGVRANMTAFGADGSVLGSADGSIEAIGPGEESIANFYFGSATRIDHVKYTVTYDDSPFYESGLTDLEFSTKVNGRNVIVTVENKGTEASRFLEVYALFFDKAGNLVSQDWGYIVDDDSELKPGARLSKQMESYCGFDTVEVYFNGRRGGY